MSLYKKLKKLHPDMDGMFMDEHTITIIFNDCLMEVSEFKEGSKTKKILLDIFNAIHKK